MAIALIGSAPINMFCVQARAAVLTASQCATYDEAKKAWMKVTGGGDTMSTHVGASMVSGLVTTTLTAPVDVIKTNMFAGMLPTWPNLTYTCKWTL